MNRFPGYQLVSTATGFRFDPVNLAQQVAAKKAEQPNKVVVDSASPNQADKPASREVLSLVSKSIT